MLTAGNQPASLSAHDRREGRTWAPATLGDGFICAQNWDFLRGFTNEVRVKALRVEAHQERTGSGSLAIMAQAPQSYALNKCYSRLQHTVAPGAP